MVGCLVSSLDFRWNSHNNDYTESHRIYLIGRDLKDNPVQPFDPGSTLNHVPKCQVHTAGKKEITLPRWSSNLCQFQC